MQSLVIDATRTLNNLTESFWTDSRLATIGMTMILLIVGLIGTIICMIIFFSSKGRSENAAYFGILFSIMTMVTIIPLSDGFSDYSKYEEKSHVNADNMSIKTLTYDLKISKTGDVVSSTRSDDKVGTINVEVVDRSGETETVKISKKNIDTVYNSDAKPTLTVEKVTDKGTNKSYYVAQKLVLNNQPIQYK